MKLTTVTVRDEGTFRTSVTVPKKTDAGDYRVVATEDDAGQASAGITVMKSGGGIGGIIKDIIDWLWKLLFG